MSKKTSYNNAEEVRARRARNVAAGVCRYAASHGPATRGQMCSACYGDVTSRSVEGRRDRITAGLCIVTASHGPPTHGQLCDACYAVEQRSHTAIRHRRAGARAATAPGVGA
jgi:hypothetical protein